MAEIVDSKEDGDVQYREKRELPRSVSVYEEIQTESAHEALLEASKTLFNLADYVEGNFSPDDSQSPSQMDERYTTTMNDHDIQK